MKTRLFIGLSLFINLFSCTPAIAAEFDPKSCEDMVRIAPRGVEPSFNIELKVKQFYYRISIAMLAPTSQRSMVVGQLFWSNGLRNAELENYLIERFRRAFKTAQVTDMGTFVRIHTMQIERDDFQSLVKTFETHLRNRVTAPSKILANFTPLQRNRSAEVREAAHTMLALLRRSKVSDQPEDLDKILSKTHTHLIRSLTERELRFFDYDLFGEVLSFEKDIFMQSIARKAREQVADARDLDYMAIHEEIRRKFVTLAREQVESLKHRDLPYLERVKRYVNAILKSGEAVVSVKETFPNLPFSEDGFRHFVDTMKQTPINIYNVQEIRSALDKLKILDWEQMQAAYDENQKLLGILSADENKRERYTSNPSWRTLYFDNSYLQELLNFLEKDHQDHGLNEPANTVQSSNLFYVHVVKIRPSNGGEQGSSFLGMDTGIASSFQHQPHRLYSGRGQNKSGFDYTTRERDTPDFE